MAMAQPLPDRDANARPGTAGATAKEFVPHPAVEPVINVLKATVDAGHFDACVQFRELEPGRLGLVGYSDGASYALSVGLSNPELFRGVMGWAAGFVAIENEAAAAGVPRPAVLVEYGTHDELFPFEQVALPMREQLEGFGCAVTFRVDQGGRHWPSGEFQQEALDWFFSEPWQPRS